MGKLLSKIEQEIRLLSKNKRKRKIYYHACKLKKYGYSVDTLNMVFEGSFSSFEEFPVPDRYHARMLIRMGFNYQINLFNTKQI